MASSRAARRQAARTAASAVVSQDPDAAIDAAAEIGRLKDRAQALENYVRDYKARFTRVCHGLNVMQAAFALNKTHAAQMALNALIRTDMRESRTFVADRAKALDLLLTYLRELKSGAESIGGYDQVMDMVKALAPEHFVKDGELPAAPETRGNA